MKYFYINNLKFNYTLEFNTNLTTDSWKQNVPLIDYCETLGIKIPHYCFHKNLSISGNCRMCLIELKNSPKPLVSCAMSAKSCLNNAELFTNSPLVKKARENVLEFLLLNHPLDCPICDQGGECDLQDQSFFFGLSKKRFYSFKRFVTDKNLGPIVKTVMTRCIHCTRCVRFANEIAGVEDLGVFGRGLHSEIGTYVTKVFQSELSGNVIDLCPVGALTSKPYPFISRNWELKSDSGLDFSDGFLVNIQIYKKNNKIVKILPDQNPNLETISWISDKTRFSYDGMFSPDRVLEGFIVEGSGQKTQYLPWKILFEEIIRILYFQDHLNRHFLEIKPLIICFDGNISNEVINLLLLLIKKYTFIQLRKTEPFLVKNDLESSFMINFNGNCLKLKSSNLAFLLAVNTRYEGSVLNQRLRQRYLKGNFKVISLGSNIEVKIPITFIGLSFNVLNTIFEGNNFFCQEILNSRNPQLIASSEIFKRKDSLEWINLLRNLSYYQGSFADADPKIHILNSSINDAGLIYLNAFKALTELDLKASFGLFFLNTSYNSSNLQKIIEFKLLNFFKQGQRATQFLIELNSKVSAAYIKTLLKFYEIRSYTYLPCKVFFETSGTYVNTEGFLKKKTKMVAIENLAKDSWQILRKLFTYCRGVNFLSNPKFNLRLSFNSNNISNLQNFTGFQYYATKSFNNLTRFEMRSSTIFSTDFKKYRFKQNKTYQTQMRLWLDDFFIGGNDSYSRYSLTMIKCSQLLRLNSRNFNMIL